jgi:hypothetical protein
LVDPKHKNKLRQSESVIPLEDKLSIKVYDGMCLLHDGSILHAVSKHNNDLPRDVLVFEFESIFV